MADYNCNPDYTDTGALDSNNGTSYGLRVGSLVGGLPAAKIAPPSNIKLMASPKGTLTGCKIAYIENASLDGATDKVNYVGHPFVDGEPVMVTWGSTKNAGTPFYVRNPTADPDAFQLSSTRGGAAFDFSSGTVNVASCWITCPAGNHKRLINPNTTSGWTGGTNVTVTSNSANYVYWGNAILLTVGASPATGRIALYDFGATTDLSTWGRIEIGWSASAVPTAGTWTIRFYSDSGVTEIAGSAITIPTSQPQSTSGSIVYFDGRQQLPSNVRSFAIEYSGSLPAARAIRIYSIGAFKSPYTDPNSINTTSYFSKGDFRSWKVWGTRDYPTSAMATISDTVLQIGNRNLVRTVHLAMDPWIGPNVTTSDTLYVYHALASQYVETGSNNNNWFDVTESGTAANRNTLSGGWNRTDMSTQGADDITVVTSLSGVGRALAATVDFVDMSRVFVLGPITGTCGAVQNDRTYTNCGLVGCSTLSLGGVRVGIDGFIWSNMTGNSTTWSLGSNCTAKGIKVVGVNGAHGWNVYPGVLIDDVTAINMQLAGLSIATCAGRNGHNFEKVHIDKAGSLIAHTNQCDATIGKLTYALVTVVRATVTDGGFVSIERLGGIAGNSWGFGYVYQISRVTDVVDGSAVASMKVEIVSTTGAPSTKPARRLLTVYKHSASITAGQTVSISLRMRRSHATNIVPSLFIRGTADGSTAIDRETAMTAAANTWETVTVSYTADASDEEIYIWWEAYATTATDFFHVNPESLTVTVT